MSGNVIPDLIPDLLHRLLENNKNEAVPNNKCNKFHNT